MKRLAILLYMILIQTVCYGQDEHSTLGAGAPVYVSAKTGVYYDMWLDQERENPIIGMQIREEDSSVWRIVSPYTIMGFTYEKGNEYELLVKKTTLANPPQDDVNVRYELTSIVSKTKV